MVTIYLSGDYIFSLFIILSIVRYRLHYFILSKDGRREGLLNRSWFWSVNIKYAGNQSSKYHEIYSFVILYITFVILNLYENLCSNPLVCMEVRLVKIYPQEIRLIAQNHVFSLREI